MNEAYKTAISRFLMIAVISSVVILAVKFMRFYSLKYADRVASNYLDNITGGYIALDEYYGFVSAVGNLGFSVQLSVDRYDGTYYDHYDITDIDSVAVLRNGLQYFILKDRDFVTVTLVKKGVTIRESRTMHGSGVLK